MFVPVDPTSNKTALRLAMVLYGWAPGHYLSNDEPIHPFISLNLLLNTFYIYIPVCCRYIGVCNVIQNAPLDMSVYNIYYD